MAFTSDNFFLSYTKNPWLYIFGHSWLQHFKFPVKVDFHRLWPCPSNMSAVIECNLRVLKVEDFRFKRYCTYLLFIKPLLVKWYWPEHLTVILRKHLAWITEKRFSCLAKRIFQLVFICGYSWCLIVYSKLEICSMFSKKFPFQHDHLISPGKSLILDLCP